jgi:UDP-glucose 4-epimerase
VATAPPALAVAITGPTGDIGRSLLHALEESDEVGRVVAMARRPSEA